MVDWLMQQSAVLKSRHQTVGMWQALLEEGVIVHGESVCCYDCLSVCLVAKAECDVDESASDNGGVAVWLKVRVIVHGQFFCLSLCLYPGWVEDYHKGGI